MHLTITISDDILPALNGLAPRLGLDQDQLIEKALSELIDKYWVSPQADLQPKKQIESLFGAIKIKNHGSEKNFDQIIEKVVLQNDRT